MIRAIPTGEVTFAADETKYHDLGAEIPRGDGAKIMSRSQLALFDQCPSEWMAGVSVEKTKAMDWGDLMDARITNPATLAKFMPAPTHYWAEPKKKGEEKVQKPWNMNADVCKLWWELQQREGRIPVKAEIWEASKVATTALCRDLTAGAFVASCQFQVQVRVEWHDEITGLNVPLKCLIDLVPSGKWAHWLGDYKTANDLTAHAWTRKVFDEDYHTQSALYMDAFNAASGEKRNTFVHIIQRSTAPFQTARRMLDEDYLQLGRLNYQRQLRRYCQCLANDDWPDYDSDRQEFGELIDGFRLVSPLAWMVGA